MARTQITTSSHERKEVWEEKLFRDTMVTSYFIKNFAGKAAANVMTGMDFESSANDIVQVKTNLAAKGKKSTRKGDKINFFLVPRIDPATNAGVTSGQTLKGREIALQSYEFEMELERYRQAVSAGSTMDWQRSAWNIPTEARSALLTWGVEKVDLLAFEALDSTATSTFYTTSSGTTRAAAFATGKAALTAADSKLTPKMVSFIKTWCMTGGARAGTQVPLRPVMIGGKKYYVLLVHPDVLYDWKNDSTVMQAHREARERSEENPIFSGASYIWDGVVIHEHENVTIGTDAGAGSNVPFARCHLLGAQSLCLAVGERPSLVEDTEDFGEDHFLAWGMTMKMGKPQFNSKDYGSVTLAVSRTNVSGV